MADIKREKAPAGYGYGAGETTETHPAFGMIGINRCGSNNTRLFGSAIKHDHFISFTIKRAERRVDPYHEWYFGREELIRISLSGVQFGELLSSMNMGDGVPCTIERYHGESMGQIPNDDVSFKAESQQHLADNLDKMFEEASKLVKSANEILSRSGTMSKKEKDELKGQLCHIGNSINSNLKFAGRCFDEKMEKVIMQAKGEVAAFVDHKIHAAGLEHLGSKLVSLDHLDKPTIEITSREND